ncbi:protein of unknown function [Taphrina deformans PYCC 5710]|uniref:Uncharacterized protein n=1 Tax=Taphrina deformans (strain PYCC 5710 / ATCC 11124 / CBS 356.35 / IMI 108563 / JCM 9778 / NBRC 8474) TaxID=1097556 RepID=R4XI10_TAPDE|nr:protein of unknown function [Taphrina deformans PYCC 5710]|eukprot:CCG83037.1 protein of unknown function [Taphrina deformans PYCC 5710]
MTVWEPQSNTWASAGSVSRNKEPIANALDEYLEARESASFTHILEIASGFGDHVRVFAGRHPEMTFQPTEAQRECLETLSQIRQANVLPPRKLNVLDDNDWGALKSAQSRFDGIININMIHISPPASTEALFKHATTLLTEDGFVFLYGAYLSEDGTFASAADERFDASLKERDAAFGLRHPGDVDATARKYNFTRVVSKTMALNNRIFIWRYTGQTGQRIRPDA